MSRTLTMALALATLPLAMATVTAADPAPASSLGLAFFEADAALTTGDGRGVLRLTGDFRISSANGLQFGLAGSDMPNGWLGRVEGHLYLQPQPDRKYGFYASAADVDGRDLTIIEGGVESMWALAPGTLVEGRAGAGLASHGIDFVAISGRLDRQISDRLAVFAAMHVVDVDEATTSATSIAADLGLRYMVPRSNFELSLAITGDKLVGRDSRPAESYVSLGLTWRLGANPVSQSSVDSRAFETINSVDSMIRRRMF